MRGTREKARGTREEATQHVGPVLRVSGALVALLGPAGSAAGPFGGPVPERRGWGEPGMSRGYGGAVFAAEQPGLRLGAAE